MYKHTRKFLSNTRTPVAIFITISILCIGWQQAIDAETSAALERIDADSLKGDLSFLASDLLQGRDTPSPGLDLASEYIASEFRKHGVEPGTPEGYFQTAPWPVNGEPKAKVRNVIGVIRGTDPFLKGTYVLVSAHYDHLGLSPDKEAKDRIYNGANDDGSGTVGVVELASALASAHVRPKRTLVFALWFGEEKGLVGSRYYCDHPVFPLNKTVAMINLEQIGRTDDESGPRKRAVAMTGYDYSDLGSTLRDAARQVGIDVQKDPVNSDAFFGRSDNLAFASHGIPAHTLCTAFIYPDYHKVSDEWSKVDYANEAAVLKGICVGVMTVANAKQPPAWNSANPKADEYRSKRPSE